MAGGDDGLELWEGVRRGCKGLVRMEEGNGVIAYQSGGSGSRRSMPGAVAEGWPL